MVEVLHGAIHRLTEERGQSEEDVRYYCLILIHLFIVSAHLTDSVLKDPKTSIMPAKPKWIGFQPMIISFLFPLL